MSPSPNARRPWGLLALLGLAVAAALVAPAAMTRAGDRAAEQARAAADPARRREARARAAEWYEMAAASPLGGAEAARQARLALAQEEEADFEQARQSLAGGVDGARAHLAWLDVQAQQPGWPGERARLARIRAQVSYGAATPEADPQNTHPIRI